MMQVNSTALWQEHLTESLVQSINVWVNVCDRHLNILVWNPTAERLSGFSAAEVIGHALVWDWLYPDVEYRNSVVSLTQRVLVRDGQISDVETEITCKNGEQKIIAWYSRPLLDEAGVVQGFVTFGYDGTDRRRAELALQKAHNELHVLYEIASITNAIADLDRTLVRCLERILSVMQSRGGLIHLWDADLQRLIIGAQCGVIPEQFPSEMFLMEVYQRGAQLHQQSDRAGTVIGMPMRANGHVYGVISVICTDGTQASADERALLTSIADQIGIAVENARLYRQSQQLAVAEERRRLARDLHDSVTQSLYSLTLFAEAGQRLLRAGDIERVEKYLDRLSKTAQDALKEMRLLLYELRPWSFEPGKLIETLQHRLDSVERRSGLTAHLITMPLPALPPSIEDSLYRIALEALNNALRHAFASAVIVTLRCDETSISLEVSDNGTGFNPEAARQCGGMGLVNMCERAEALGGSLLIDSVPAAGTTVKVVLPLHNSLG
ncbi:MAG: histidine kinase [Aggregatilineales bacterium]